MMSRDIIDTVGSLLTRVKTNCVAHELDSVIFNFHGGEPLPPGPEFFRCFVAGAEAILRESITPT